MEKLTLVSTVKKKLSRLKVRPKTEPPTPEADTFAGQVLAGLRSFPKYLPSKFLYDSRGDALFQQITTLPEYYLTRCEEEILDTYKDKIAAVASRFAKFRLIELGPGDGHKTKILLEALVRQRCVFSYHPIDISANVLGLLEKSLSREFPGLPVAPLAADYMVALGEISRASHLPCIILFMGGNIGNFSKPQAAAFMETLAGQMRQGDMLLCGFDLKKDPAVIYHAYNDRQGVTRSFNFNLLRRINRELGADFNVDNFVHYPTYDPQSGEMKSYLIAARAHKVRTTRPQTEIVFGRWEPVHMEVSNKYSEEEIVRMCGGAGFSTEALLYDKKKYYVVTLLHKGERDGAPGKKQ